jgi:integrase
MADSFSTIQQLKAFKAKGEPYEVRDEAIIGGRVRILVSGQMSYVYRYKFANKSHKLFVGRINLDAGGLAEARMKAREAANAVTAARSSGGLDPVTEAKLRRVAQANSSETPKDHVEKVVRDFIRLYARPHLKDWKETARLLNKEIVSRWGEKSLSELTSAEVRAAMRVIAERAPIGANRTLARFKKLCNWAIEQEIISNSPVERVKALTPERGHARERTLSDQELARVWQGADALGFPFGPITQLLILTGQRRGEVAGMTWAELDLIKRLWVIPAVRSKNGLSHPVFLTDPAIRILKNLPRFDRDKSDTDFVFSSGTTEPSGFSRAKRRLDREIKASGELLNAYVIHDLRRSAASGMARLGVALPVVERCLNHVSGSFGGIVGVYQRHSYADEMREAFSRWAAHVDGLLHTQTSVNVVELRDARITKESQR